MLKLTNGQAIQIFNILTANMSIKISNKLTQPINHHCYAVYLQCVLYFDYRKSSMKAMKILKISINCILKWKNKHELFSLCLGLFYTTE